MVIRGLSTVKKSNYFQNCQNCSWFFMSQNLSNKLHSRICSKRVGEHMTEKIEAQHYQLFFAWLFTFGKRQFRWQSYSITCSHALWKSVHPIFVTCELGDEEIRKKMAWRQITGIPWYRYVPCGHSRIGEFPYTINTYHKWSRRSDGDAAREGLKDHKWYQRTIGIKLLRSLKEFRKWFKMCT